ncbi:FliH/SctL family protein [Nocardioides sp.]|uniref:FliH/SctL family protein n=1 Tax=Nocardioides sp. TaxID=35761 RepID=UPI001A2436A4|nr:FliH/SctL family protein [Nocardioides sp.]MBJ7359163.1 hypothetical protein [Nocardioides sp.]
MSSSTSRAFLPLQPLAVAEDAPVRDGQPPSGALGTSELRSGEWTRFGPSSVLGDEVTERALGAMVADARAAARSQGYAVGWAQGLREASDAAALAARANDEQLAETRRQWTVRHQAAVEALHRAARELARVTEDVQDLVRRQSVDLARELTEIMVGHELRSSPDTAADVVTRVLAAAPADRPFVVHLHPDVADDDAVAALAGSGVRVVGDPTLDPADAMVEVDEQVLDLRVRTAIARVREVLS